MRGPIHHASLICSLRYLELFLGLLLRTFSSALCRLQGLKVPQSVIDARISLWLPFPYVNHENENVSTNCRASFTCKLYASFCVRGDRKICSCKFARRLAKRGVSHEGGCCLRQQVIRSHANSSYSRHELSRLLFFSGSMHIRIFAGEGLFLAAKVEYVAGETRTTRRTAGCLDALAPVFKHQMLAEMRSMLRAFLPFPELFLQEFRWRHAVRVGRSF